MTQQFLSEFVDGGPACSRDDCDVIQGGWYPPILDPTQSSDVVQHQNKRCSSCGKSWTETWQNGTRLS
jgi:hypothetical protein